MALKVNPALNIPTKSSSYGAWIEWHKELVDAFGLKNANAIFLKAWEVRQPDSFLSQIDYSDRHKLIEYLQQNGLKIDENGIDTIAGYGYGIADTIGGVFKAGKTFVYIILGIVVLFLLLLAINIGRNPNATLKTARG